MPASSGAADSVDVFTPDVPSPAEASARITTCAKRWAALRGVPIRLLPAADRIAHPIFARGEASSPGSVAPTVTIGLPVYNGEAFLAETLESLLAQTYVDFELIICDNGSSDRTGEICESYAARDERIRYLRSERNRGAAWNYNRALDAAVGRYFKWASHDDLCAPTYLERCVEVLDRAPDSVVLVYPKTALIDGNGEFLGPYEDGLDLRRPEPYQRLQSLIRNLVMSNGLFGLIRIDALRRTHGHGAYISADYILLAELAMQGQFWEIPETLFLRRDHPGMSRRANRTPSQLAAWFKTEADRRHQLEYLRLFREYVSAVDRAPNLTRFERLRAFATVLPWLHRFHRGMTKELMGLLISRPEEAVAASHVSHATQIEQVQVHQRIRSALWSIAPDRGRDVQIHVDPQLTIDADRAALDRVLVNLLSNAVRYGSSPITCTASANGGFELTIEDKGRGIAPEFLPRLFEPFSRSTESAHTSPGLGLGLAISKISAEDSGGSLSYEAANPGARFRLRLPRNPHAG